MGDKQRRLQHEKYYRERLADAEDLLCKAVWMEDHGLAVPVGLRRQSGFLSFGKAEEGPNIVAKLSKHDGFPELRIVLSEDPECCHNVEWGLPIPEYRDEMDNDQVDDLENVMGKVFGYKCCLDTDWCKGAFS